jgi:uncharacterized protein YdhG (YjbR/CyaY superfamily)
VALLEIDRYLAALDEPKRSTLDALRKSIMEIVPGAEQCISYGMPAFKVKGKTVAGFAAFKNHRQAPHQAIGEEAHQRSNAGARVSALIIRTRQIDRSECSVSLDEALYD